ncbi:MAG: hypothetical protein LBN01_04195 [Endomicrobium sp.]|jgi:hypothetical protein|nr:hypothetical protein [Endomicrobium sp.]
MKKVIYSAVVLCFMLCSIACDKRIIYWRIDKEEICDNNMETKDIYNIPYDEYDDDSVVAAKYDAAEDEALYNRNFFWFERERF